MSEEINLRGWECQALYEQLVQFHEAQLTAYQKGVSEIRKLLEEPGGFYAADVNKKLSLVLDVMEQQLLPGVKRTFEKSEEDLAALLSEMQEADTVSR